MSRLHPLPVIVCTLLAVASSGADARPPAEGASNVSGSINDALWQRDYARAVQLIDQALPAAKVADREYLMFRRGVALYYRGDHAGAIAAFKQQLDAYPDGPWAHKARFRTADAHVAMKQFAEAEAIYARRVRELVGDGRKAEIARVYLEFADEYFSPKDALIQADFGKALSFYEKALELEPGGELRDDLLYKQALCQQKLGNHGPAAGHFEAYLLSFDEAFRELHKTRNAGAPLPASAGRAGRHCDQARLGLGESLLAQGQAVEARRVLQDLVKQLDMRRDLDEAARGAWLSAHVELAKTYGMPAPSNALNLTPGLAALQRILEKHPETKQAIQAAFDIGKAQAHLGRHDEAIAAHRALIDRSVIRPGDDETRKLAETLSQEAMYTIGQLFFSQKKYSDAIGTWNQYTAKYPSGPHWSDAQKSIVDAEFAIGADAKQDQRYDDARQAWTAFLQKYPLDSRTAMIMYDFGEMSYQEQVQREKKEGPAPVWNEPIGHWSKLVNKYPASEEAGLAQFRIGQTLEEKVGDLEQAIEAYRKLTWSSHILRAQQRINEMKSVRLAVQTERVYRTDEPARIRVDVRNIDKLTVKLYRIDMEDYFRKDHSLAGVENLDLLLIDPDATFDVDVKDYAAYRPITQEIEIPFEGAGVQAVYVSNEKSTQAREEGTPTRLESTTLLLRSDIDIAVKSSRNQVLVFAQDMLAGKPAAGVRVLVSDGKKVLFEGRTGEDGVWMESSKEIRDAGGLSVFAAREGHIAGTGLNLGGLSFATGLQPRGYLYTDRPAYRPGEGVSIRGILREVTDGAYSLPTQPEDKRLRWMLDIIDPRGRALVTEPIVLTDFGSFAASFLVPQDAAVGDYKLIARRVEGPTFSSAFSVQTYQLPKAFLSFDFAERVILRGQPIKGAVVAKYHYGEPVVDKVIEYAMRLPTGDVIRRSGVTDKQGRVAFEFDSTTLPEEGTASFGARQADLDIAASDAVFVAVRAFTAEILTLRDLYLAEEPVEFTVRAENLKGEPIAQDMTVTALLRTRDDGRWAETRIESADVKTGEKDGAARASFKLTKGGSYVLRAEGKDQFGHVVSAETALMVSDDEDDTRLRLFTGKQHYKVGDAMSLDVHARIESPVKMDASRKSAADRREEFLALVTCEGETILSHRIVTIRAGHNPVELAIGHQHFPNATISVAVMSGGRLHEATREFTVERELHVAIKTDKATYQPREEVSVELTVTDQQGRPVSAEVGLAMIDQALLTRFPDSTPEIVKFFQEGARRSAGWRTQSSCTFRYNAATRSMVTDVLDEEIRLAEAEAGATVDIWTIVRENASVGQFGLGYVDANVPPPGAPASAPGQQLAQRGAGVFRMDEAKEGRGRAPGGGGGQEALFAGGALIEGEEADMDAETLGKKVLRLRLEQASANEVQERVFFLGQQFKFNDDLANKQMDWEFCETVRSAPPRTYYPEVAFWHPRIVTDEAGKATVKIVVPDSSTTWQLIARGATKETIVGQARAEVVSRSDFLIELLTPPTLVAGDKTQPRAQVHCLVDGVTSIDVTLDFATDGKPYAKQSKTIKVNGKGVYDVVIDDIEVPSADKFVATCSAVTTPAPNAGAMPLRDAVTREMPVRPWGMRIESHASAVASDSEFVTIDLPKEMADGGYHDRHLTIVVGPGLQRWLIEEALERGPRWENIDLRLKSWEVAPPRTHADNAAALLAALYAGDYVRSLAASGRATGADASLLGERVSGLVAQLLASQNDDGGWTWCGRGSGSDPWTSAYVAWALGKAQASGHVVSPEAVRNLSALLKKVFADTQATNTEMKSVVLHGLSWLEEVDFGHANRLFRNRQSLSNSAMAHLALTFARLDRKPMAAELLADLSQRLKTKKLGQRTCKRLPASDNAAWMQSDLEVTAMALLAQLQVDPAAEVVKPMVDYLAGSARAEGWRPHKAKGAVVAALSMYYASGKAEQANFRLNVAVNGKAVRELTSQDAMEPIVLGPAELADGKQRIDFTFDGRGEYAYAVTLSGFASEFPRENSGRATGLHAQVRWYQPPVREYKGRPVSSGFSVATDYNSFINRAKHVPQGSVIQVQVNLGRSYRTGMRPDTDFDYVIAQEAIPAGFRLLTETLTGQHFAYDYTDNLLTLYFGTHEYLGTIQYQLVATTPGEYRVQPTILRSLYQPNRFNLSKADEISVIQRDAKNPDDYRMTPDELYTLGRMHFDDGELGAADEYLKQLLKGDWILRDDPYRQSVRMLLTCALKRDDAEAIVNYFEILKEKYPELFVPYDEIVRVADAYSRTGQHERAYLVYRATADASFIRESAVGGVLQGEGRFLDGMDFQTRLWREYPDTPQVTSVYFAVSQALYAQADKARTLAPRKSAGAGGREAKRLTRSTLIGEAIGHLETFLALYPENPTCDEASYSLANAWLDLDSFRTVIALSKRMIELYPRSKWADQFRYMQALANFHLGEFEKALGLAQQVADATYIDEHGVVRPSPNKWLALYIIGQIHHARGDTKKAIDYYAQVKTQFSDAAEAVSIFEQKMLRLPEVTIFHPDGTGFRESDEWARWLRGRRPGASDSLGMVSAAPLSPPAKHDEPFVQIDYRNLDTAVLQVYRVDLMKLALLEKNLNQITAVNLAGVKPMLEKSVSLGDGQDFRDKSLRVPLDLPRDKGPGDREPRSAMNAAGAYLVICRAGEKLASGLVLVTPLAVEVQEDTDSGRARVTVVDAISRDGETDVHVKVIGNQMSNFVSGDTDLRGLFAADGISGYATAIARDPAGHFAFYRSEQAEMAMAADRLALREQARKPAAGETKADYRYNLNVSNSVLQMQNCDMLGNVWKQKDEGVQVQKAQ